MLRITSPTILCISQLHINTNIYWLSPNLPEGVMSVNQTSGLPYTLGSRRLHTANTILPCTEDTACACNRLQGETTHAHQLGPVCLKRWKNLCSYHFFPQALNTLGKVWLILAGGAMRLDPISPWETPLHPPQSPKRKEKVIGKLFF